METTIGTIIRDFRTKRGMSLSLLGDKSKVNKSIISRMENGLLENPNIKTLAKIAEAMSTRASVLLKKLEEARKA